MLTRLQIALAGAVPATLLLGLLTAAPAVAATPSYSLDGGFENGGTGWQATPGTSLAVHRTGEVASAGFAHSGAAFLAASAPTTGGYVYQDRSTPLRKGDTLCVTAYVRTQSPNSAASGGAFALQFKGGGRDDTFTRSFSNAAGDTEWNASRRAARRRSRTRSSAFS